MHVWYEDALGRFPVHTCRTYTVCMHAANQGLANDAGCAILWHLRRTDAGGRKPNIWRLSQVVTPGWGAHSGSQSRNPRLDVTVRAFEQQDRGGLLNLSSRVQSEHDCVADVQASEIRLVTTRSYGRLTNKVRWLAFREASLGSRLLPRHLQQHVLRCTCR